MKNRQRLTGIDLFRGIAAYAVVLFHSGDQTWAPIAPGVTELRNFFNFAVPFFLALSFYLTTRKFYTGNSTFDFAARVKRILVPYILWTIVYLIFKSFSYIAFNQSDKLTEYFQDPAATILMGAASVQLYFLPLLLAGTLLLPAIHFLVKKDISVRGLAVLLVASTTVYGALIASGNNFQLGPNIAFQPFVDAVFPGGNQFSWIRVPLVYLAWAIRCLPYLFLSMILNHLFFRKQKNAIFTFKAIPVLLVLFLFVNTIGHLFIPAALSEILIAFSLLLLSIALSDYLPESKLINNLGLCSFGIYLFHPFPIQIIEVLVRKLNPVLLEQVSILSLLVFSIPSFLISWGVVAILAKQKWVAKYMLGI